MGLDQYLYATKYISDYGEDTKEQAKKLRDMFKIKTGGSVSLRFNVLYWRKANAIHAWFVDNVQEGEDDCKTYWVSREKLRELLDTLEKVLKLKSEKGKEPRPEKIADEYLPTSSGFFFGPTEYDEYYWDEVVRTRDEIKMLLDDKDLEDFDFEYSSSW